MVFSTRSRWHLARFDRVAPARAQLRTLLGLVHQARNTPFGREHDFRRVRSETDFRRLVPLRSASELWRKYGQPGDTWSDEHKAAGAALVASHRQAMQTALALVLRVRPHARLLAGPICWLGADTSPSSEREDSVCSAMTPDDRFPRLLRPSVHTGRNGELLDYGKFDTLLATMAHRLAG